jgi:hypothetical protein
MKAASFPPGNVVERERESECGMLDLEPARHAVVRRPLEQGAVRDETGGSPAPGTSAVLVVPVVVGVEHHDDAGLPRLEAPPGEAPLLAVSRAELLDISMAASMPATTSPALPDVVGIIHVAALPQRLDSLPVASDTPLSLSHADQLKHNIPATPGAGRRFEARAG